jgi:putative FmdB family regulatory protein
VIEVRQQRQRVVDQLAGMVALSRTDQTGPAGHQVRVFIEQRGTIHFVPIYEYHCDDCEGTFEVLTSFANRDHAQTCPTCSGERSHVQVSSFASLGAEFTGEDFATPTAATGGGCACGGACSCGGH